MYWTEMSYYVYNSDLSLSQRCEVEDEFDDIDYEEILMEKENGIR